MAKKNAAPELAPRASELLTEIQRGSGTCELWSELWEVQPEVFYTAAKQACAGGDVKLIAELLDAVDEFWWHDLPGCHALLQAELDAHPDETIRARARDIMRAMQHDLTYQPILKRTRELHPAKWREARVTAPGDE